MASKAVDKVNSEGEEGAGEGTGRREREDLYIPGGKRTKDEAPAYGRKNATHVRNVVVSVFIQFLLVFVDAASEK